jgi:twitching motility protein PilI
MTQADASTPFEILLAYERLAQAHVAAAAEQVEAPGLWRGIGFRIGGQHMVSSISEVNEILTMPAITVIPGTKSWLMGVANVRGNLVAVVDLRGFMEGSRTPINDRSRVLVARQQGGAVGLLVDEVLGQRSFTDENIPLVDPVVDDRYGRFVTKRYDLGGIVWGVFSMAALVKTPEFSQAAA